MNGLLRAYRALWRRQPGIAYALLLAAMIGNLLGLFYGLIELSPLAVIPAVGVAATIAAAHYAPGDENGDDR